jgi:hypothetical protein
LLRRLRGEGACVTHAGRAAAAKWTEGGLEQLSQESGVAVSTRTDRIRREWESFERDVVPKDAPLVQRQEMRRAFYAGARGLFRIQLDEFAAMSDAEAERGMQAIEEELRQFLRDVKEGRA